MHKGQRHSLSHFLGLTTALFLLWILFSGKFEVKFLLIGLFSSMIIAYVCRPFLYIKNQKTGKVFFVLNINPIKFILYCLWLLKEIFKSTIEVSKEILIPHNTHEPRVVYFSMPFENPICDVFLAHSIILTPGTITIDVSSDGVYEVHALNSNLAEGLLSGEMQLKIAQLFNEEAHFTPLKQMTYIRKGVK